MDLLKAYEDSIAQKRREEEIHIIYDAVYLALAPFRPTEVCLYINELRNTLTVEMKNFPSLTLKLSLDNDLSLFNPSRFYFDLAKQAFSELRNIPRIEPPDNVKLGEY